MKGFSVVAVVALAVGVGVLTSCSPPDDAVLTKGPKARECQYGYCQPDPYPDSIGLYVASSVTEGDCFGDVYTDADEDGLGDTCENALAEAFNPMLKYSSSEPAWGGEPVFVAKPVTYGNYQRVVRIMYMPAYYNDGGTSSCPLPADPFGLCQPHIGDSEAILIDVRYDDNTEHWIANVVMLSQHTGYTWFRGSSSGDIGETDDEAADDFTTYSTWTTGTYPTALTYVGDIPGGAPIVWVSRRKHANYPDGIACNSGGAFGLDSCYSNTENYFMPLLEGGNGPRNLGSSTANLMNCVATYNSSMETWEHDECFWDDSLFTGWSGQSTDTHPYLWRLNLWGY
jgi:hypothetical protein